MERVGHEEKIKLILYFPLSSLNFIDHHIEKVGPKMEMQWKTDLNLKTGIFYIIYHKRDYLFVHTNYLI